MLDKINISQQLIIFCSFSYGVRRNFTHRIDSGNQRVKIMKLNAISAEKKLESVDVIMLDKSF